MLECGLYWMNNPYKIIIYRRINISKISKDKYNINEQIRTAEVRVISSEGEMLGIIKTRQAIEIAINDGLDLVEIDPHSTPPVCKIINYGKYKYELQKKHQLAKKNQKIIEIKEVKFRPNIGKSDYDVKVRNIIKFLKDEQNKVKISLKYRGREMMHHNVGLELMLRVKTDIAEFAKIDSEPKLEDRQLIMLASPLTTT